MRAVQCSKHSGFWSFSFSERDNRNMTLPKQRTGYEKALIAEYFTVGWNILEGIIAIAAGATAASIALVRFGLDSFVEVTSGLVLIWRLRKHGFDDEEEEAAERKAILVVGITFLLLALIRQ
jgi:hypothetical protein